MRPTSLLPPFLAFNLLLGVFTVSTQNRYEIYPLTVYNLYSRIIPVANYRTILYYDREGLQHNLALENPNHYELINKVALASLTDSIERGVKMNKNLRKILPSDKPIYFVEVKGDSKALHLGYLPILDTLHVF